MKAARKALQTPPPAEEPFWRRKTLAEMSRVEWESLCDGCGKCCLLKLEYEDTGEIDWSNIARTEHAGEHGVAHWRTLEVGNVRVRIVEYSPEYLADHWCERGHVVHVIDGELVTELRDGRRFVLAAGQTYVVADGDGFHRSSTQRGARLLIVD